MYEGNFAVRRERGPPLPGVEIYNMLWTIPNNEMSHIFSYQPNFITLYNFTTSFSVVTGLLISQTNKQTNASD